MKISISYFNYLCLWLGVFASLLTYVLTDLSSKEKKELRCPVCRAVVREVNAKIEAVNPKKTVEVGSYRIDGDGNQGTRSVSYARSEIHLIDVMETICSGMDDYGITTLKSGEKGLMPVQEGSLNPMFVQNMALSGAKTKGLKLMCEYIVGDHDDDMIELYTNPDINLDEMEKSICLETVRHCDSHDLSVPFPNQDVLDVKPQNFDINSDKSSDAADEDDGGDEDGDNDNEDGGDDENEDNTEKVAGEKTEL